MISLELAGIAFFLLLYGVFLFWYGGRGQPLSQEEADAFLAEIERRSDGTEGSLLQELRELTKSDDGREFYMVNLMKFREKAKYPAGSEFGDDPMAANARYNRAIILQLFKYGGHPVFAGKMMGRFIHPEGADDWDQAAMVRYRSRRDMLKMVVGLADKDIAMHKWAALEKTQVFPVKPFLSLFSVRMIVGVFLLGLTVLAMFL